MTAAADPVPLRPVGRLFIAGMTLAQVGAFLSFMPLLTILVPLKAQAIDPAGKAAILAQVSLLGALTAGLANVLAGALSDRTRSRFGRRRPWIGLGLAGTLVAYGLIMSADSVLALGAGLVAFQFCFNFVFGPLAAVLPDQVPDAQKGRVAAFAGLAFPLGSVSGIVLAGVLIAREEWRYLAIGLILLATVAPFVVFARDPPTAGRAWLSFVRAPIRWPNLHPGRHPDFTAAWASRLLMQLTMSVVSTFALFYLQDRLQGGPAGPAEAKLALLTVVSTVCHIAAGLAAGFLSDRSGARKPYVVLGGMFLAAAAGLLAFAPTWPAALLAYACLGCGFGLYTTADAALVAQVLPSLRDAGADLGVLNLANTIPQVLAPALGLWLLAGGQGFTALFAVAAVAALAGAAVVTRIRSVR